MCIMNKWMSRERRKTDYGFLVSTLTCSALKDTRCWDLKSQFSTVLVTQKEPEPHAYCLTHFGVVAFIFDWETAPGCSSNT